MLQVACGILIEYNPGIEDPSRVEDRLDALHHAESLRPPLILDKGSHIASRAVLGLQGSVVFFHYEAHHIPDHRIVAGDILRSLETLVDDEMEIPFEGVAVDTGVIVAVAVQERGQVGCRFRKIFDMESHVFDQAGGTLLAQSAHRGEDAGADSPVFCSFGRIRSETDLRSERRKHGGSGFFHGGELLGRLRLDFREKSRQIRLVRRKMGVSH